MLARHHVTEVAIVVLRNLFSDAQCCDGLLCHVWLVAFAALLGRRRQRGDEEVDMFLDLRICHQT